MADFKGDSDEDVPLIKLQNKPKDIGRSGPEHATGLQKPESQNENDSDDDIPLVVLQSKCKDKEKTINISNGQSNEILENDNQTQSTFKTLENCNDGIEGTEEVMSETSSSEGMSLSGEYYDSDTRVVQFKMTLGLPFENEATHRKMFIPNTTLKFT